MCVCCMYTVNAPVVPAGFLPPVARFFLLSTKKNTTNLARNSGELRYHSGLVQGMALFLPATELSTAPERSFGGL